jgi:hypothetical protein
MSSSDANLIASWNNASTVFSCYIPIAIYIIGIVGNFLNILVLSQRCMLIVLLYTCIINAPIVYCYNADQSGTLLRCYGSSNACRLTTDLIYAFGTTLLPLLFMAIFSILIIRNVRRIKIRVQNTLQKVYTSFTIAPATSSLPGAIQNCIFNVFTCLTFLASGMPFYIYTLFGESTFRNGFFDLMKNAQRKIFCH